MRKAHNPRPTCRDCKKRGHCMEASRLYPCQSFERRDMTKGDWAWVAGAFILAWAAVVLPGFL